MSLLDFELCWIGLNQYKNINFIYSAFLRKISGENYVVPQTILLPADTRLSD